MLSSIFLKTLRDQRRSMMFWCIGLLALALYITLFFPLVRSFTGIEEMLEQAPKGLMAFLGGALADFTSPVGYLNAELFSFMMPLIFCAFSISAGSAAIAGEEEKGTLEFLLSNPISRRRVVVEKFGAMLASMLAVATVFWVGLVIGAHVVDMGIPLLRLAEGILTITLLGLVFGSLALALGSATGRRGASIGAAAGLAVATYFLNSLGSVVEALEDYRFLSPFYHTVIQNPLANGLDPMHTGVLVGLVAVFFAASLFFFERRDVGT